MSIKGGLKQFWNLVSLYWDSYESTGEIDTVTGDDKTVGVRAGSTISELEVTSYTEVTNGEDISGNAEFQNKKFFEVKPTLTGTSTDPLFKRIWVKVYETLASYLSKPNSHTIILAEMMIAEEIMGLENYGGALLIEDGASYILDESGNKIALE